MTNSKRLKTLLLSGVAVASVVAIGGFAYIGAEESRNVEIVADSEKPLDNLGEIAEKPQISEKESFSLYSDNEKVGETVNIEGLTRVDALGNSNKEFETFEEAQEWAESKKKEGKILSYSVLPIFWSDSIVHSYTADVVLSQ